MKIAALLISFLIFIGSITIVNAADTGTVAATVTPQSISVTVTDGSVAYGTVDLSSTQATTSGGLDDTQVATNNGNVAEDFNITSTNATGGTAWTLASTIGTDQYKHSFCTAGGGSPDPCDSTPTWTAITTAGSYQSLSTNVAASGTTRFDLQLSTPSSVADYVQKSITVTVQAVAN
ncbi:MAG: hypothetical protein Q8P13_04210 [bacterium]|nr:hypothetical protein [bacterium]